MTLAWVRGVAHDYLANVSGLVRVLLDAAPESVKPRPRSADDIHILRVWVPSDVSHDRIRGVLAYAQSNPRITEDVLMRASDRDLDNRGRRPAR